MPYPYYSPSYSPSFAPYGASTPQMVNNAAVTPQAPQSANTGIVWVQGEAGAKSYLVGAGNSVLLMDSEQSRFYIKSSDNSGMPMPLRIFEYTEINSPNTEAKAAKPQNDYITREEFEKRIKEITSKEEAPNAKSSV